MLEKQPIEPQVTEYLFAKATAALRPISGSFELTPVCNFRCSMCYVRESAESLAASHRQMQPPSFWLRLAEEAKESGMLYLLLTGGEPFLYSGFRDVYVPLSQMGFVISINTNGSAIDEDMLRLLRRYPPARINITLYGASNENL